MLQFGFSGERNVEYHSGLMLNVQNDFSELKRPSWWTISAVFFSVASVSVAPVSVGLASGTIDPELPPAAEREVNFKRDVAPILLRSCHSCHGTQKEESGLRLDVRQRALDGGDSGTTILPGNSAGSVLIHRVAGLDDAWMPPRGKGKPLTPDEIGILRAWIDQGAVWPDASAGGDDTRGKDHWAFQPIRRSTPPPLRDTAWPRNDIDRFVLAKLEENDVRPSPEADRLTLLRRLHLDLIGLPPSAAEVRACRNDDGPDAYERLVDRLLASPHYGERWGRYWLDMARYADSDGYEKDNERPHAWRWRDWVIDALNRDLPFDVFSIEQIAGDLLPNASLNQHVATGFHRNTLLNTEGGVDGEEDRVKRTVDRTNTVGEVWLGLTVECGQCHSHKYDPLTQREYYQLLAFFNNLDEPNIPAPYDRDVDQYEREKVRFDYDHEQYLARISEYERDQLPESISAWKKSLGDTPPSWHLLRPHRATARAGSKLSVEDKGTIVATGEHAESEVYTVIANTDVVGLTAIRLEVLPDDRFPNRGPGRGHNGNFILTSFRVFAAPKDATGDEIGERVVLHAAHADVSQRERQVTAALDDGPDGGWGIHPSVGKAHSAVFETREDVGFDGGTRLTFELHHGYFPDHTVGRFRIWVISMPRPVSLPVVDVLQTPAAERSEEQKKTLETFYRTVDPEFARLVRISADHQKNGPKDPRVHVRAQTVKERDEPRATHIHIRGDFLRKGAAVEAGVPSFLPELKKKSAAEPSRLDFAHWLFSDEHPLTARVLVNRLWQQYFGRGIVPTDNDFGTQGDPPSHPELLDLLATRFREGGWRLKALHRLIVTSSTYRQSSNARPDLVERDPLNTWLARQVRLRVEAEVVRDLGLTSSGLFHPGIGGPSVRPPQPDHVSALGFGGRVRWPTSTGMNRYRRGLYTFFQRTVPYPMLVTFDAADANTSCTRRERSNTPLQALTLWNDPVFFEMAQALGRRVLSKEPEEDAASRSENELVDRRLVNLIETCLGRAPRRQERAILHQLYATQLAALRADDASAAKVIGDQPLPDGISRAELGAWIAVARTVMNTDEFITRS